MEKIALEGTRTEFEIKRIYYDMYLIELKKWETKDYEIRKRTGVWPPLHHWFCWSTGNYYIGRKKKAKPVPRRR